MADKLKRTDPQRKSSHLWFKHIATEFNEHGFDVQMVLAKRMEIWWTGEAVKEVLFKGAMKHMYPTKNSTAELTKEEHTNVAEALRNAIARDYGLDIDYPNRDGQENEIKEREWRK